MVAFDDRVAILRPLPGDLDLEGAVDGRRLAAFLAKAKGEVVDLSASDGRLAVRAGRSRAAFDLLPVTLPVDTVDMTGEMVPLPAGFVDRLKWSAASCSKDASRPVLTCVLVADGWMRSSDGYRASRVRAGSDDLPRLMLPLDQIKVVADYLVRRAALSDGGEWARFETDDGVTLCARSIAGEFPPDLDTHFAVGGRELRLSAALAEAVGRAEIFAKREVETDEEVRVSLRPNQVAVSAECDGASFSEVVRCDGIEGGAEFAIHPRHLASALASGTKCVLGERSVLFSGEDWEIVIALKV